MQRFSSQDLQRNGGVLQESALVAPIAIAHRGRDRLVMMSMAEFERLKLRDRQSIAIEDMPSEFIDAMRTPHHDPEAAALDYLLDEDPGEWSPEAKRLLDK